MKKIAVKVGKNALAIAFWVAVWLIIALIVNEKLIVPTPWAVLQAFGEIIKAGDFWLSASTSFVRVILGVIISFAVGCLFAYLIAKSKMMDSLLSPLLSIVKATPVASFIIIAWVWFDTSYLPAFIASLIVVPIITSNILQGINSIDRELLEVATVYKFSPLKKLLRLYVPSIAPYFFAACRSSLGMAWKASIAAEMIVMSKNSIGKEIYLAKTDFETAPVFAWTIVVIILSVVIEKSIIFIFNRIGKSLRVMPKGEAYVKN